MKKIFLLIFMIIVAMPVLIAQHFKGSWHKVSNSNHLEIAFKIKSLNQLNTGFSYFETAFRYPVSGTPLFNITSVIPNTAAFPGLEVFRIEPDYTEEGYNYCRFVFNTNIFESRTYNAGTEYTLFNITTSLPESSAPAFEMVSNHQTTNYVFGVTNEAGLLLDPQETDHLYGPGFYRENSTHILPLIQTVLPVKFLEFTASLEGKNAHLKWVVENQDNNTKLYEVQRSTNGADFSTFKTILSNQFTGSAFYETIDYGISNIGADNIFYRIRQIDFDGKVSLSEIRKLPVMKNKFKTRVFPNPVFTNTITLDFELLQREKISILIYDTKGRLIHKESYEAAAGRNLKKVKLNGFASGAYRIKLVVNDTEDVINFIKH